MAQIAGKLGEIMVGGTTQAGMKSWTIDYTVEALETTDFADTGTKSYIAGMTGWSGSFEGFKDAAPLTIGTEIALILKESTDATQRYTGQAIVTGLNGTVSVDGIVGEAYTFQGTGALVIPTA
jgi:predicted secreted protein